MMNKKVLCLLAVFCLITGLVISILIPAAASGQDQITVENSRVSLDFPLSLTFSAKITSSARITDIRLRYQVDQMTYADIFAEGFVVFDSATSVNASYKLDMRRFGGFPPGTRLEYWWAVEDAAGSDYETLPQSFTVTDNRYKWKTLSEGQVDLFWYQGDAAFAQALMDTARNSLVKLAEDTGASPRKTISIYIYASSEDLQGSMIYPSEWTGGVSFTQYNIITIGISPSNLDWGKSAMTHELTHNVIGQVIFNPYNDIPVWLNEGLAMRYQGDFSSQFRDPLTRAIKADQLISVRTISSPFSAYSDKANLSYAESYTLVEYLINQYGSAKMSELLNTFQQGNTFDGAFEAVLGLDLDQLNQDWQDWVKTAYAK